MNRDAEILFESVPFAHGFEGFGAKVSLETQKAKVVARDIGIPFEWKGVDRDDVVQVDGKIHHLKFVIPVFRANAEIPQGDINLGKRFYVHKQGLLYAFEGAGKKQKLLGLDIFGSSLRIDARGSEGKLRFFEGWDPRFQVVENRFPALQKQTCRKAISLHDLAFLSEKMDVEGNDRGIDVGGGDESVP